MTGAEILVRLYPAAWRSRYAEEFTQLLDDQRAAAETDARWWLDVVAHALRARVRAVGAGGSTALFLLPAVTIWGQVAVGWQWAAPEPRVRSAMIAMTAGLAAAAAIVAASALARAGLAAQTFGGRRAVRGSGATPVLAITVLTVSGAALIGGSLWAGSHWPGSGGHPWPDRGLAPAGLARLAWAQTAWVSSYWVHPAQLLRLSVALLTWMVVCPLLLAAALRSVRSLRRLSLGTPVPRRALGAAMGLFTVGATLWLIDDPSGPHGLYGVGAIDVVLVVLLAAGIARTWSPSTPDGLMTR